MTAQCRKPNMPGEKVSTIFSKTILRLSRKVEFKKSYSSRQKNGRFLSNIDRFHLDVLFFFVFFNEKLGLYRKNLYLYQKTTV